MTTENAETLRARVADALERRAADLVLKDGGSRRSKQAAQLVRGVADEVRRGEHG